MPNKVDLANISLREIGATTITSFTQGNKSANTVNEFYDETRRRLLAHPWKFARQQVKLSRSGTTPIVEFSYAYVLPSDYLYTVGVFDNDSGVGTITVEEAQVAGQRVLLSNAEDVYLTYTKDEEDTNLMSASFRRALVLMLASQLAVPIANSRGLKADLASQAQTVIMDAKSDDSIGSTPKPRPQGSWVTARYGWR